MIAHRNHVFYGNMFKDRIADSTIISRLEAGSLSSKEYSYGSLYDTDNRRDHITIVFSGFADRAFKYVWLENYILLFKVAREDKRRIKKTIFYLLEVRHHLALFAGEEHGIKRYVTILRNKFSTFFPKNVTDDQIHAAVSLILKDILKEKPLITDDDLENLSTNYSKSVEGLSEIDPILAFRLHGRQNIQLVLKDFTERTRVSVAKQSNNPTDVSEFDSAFDKIGPNVITALLDDLDEIILSLAKKIDRRTYRDAKRRVSATMSIQQQKQLLKFAEKILSGMPITFNQANQPSSHD